MSGTNIWVTKWEPILISNNYPIIPTMTESNLMALFMELQCTDRQYPPITNMAICLIRKYFKDIFAFQSDFLNFIKTHRVKNSSFHHNMYMCKQYGDLIVDDYSYCKSVIIQKMDSRDIPVDYMDMVLAPVIVPILRNAVETNKLEPGRLMTFTEHSLTHMKITFPILMSMDEEETIVPTIKVEKPKKPKPPIPETTITFETEELQQLIEAVEGFKMFTVMSPSHYPPKFEEKSLAIASSISLANATKKLHIAIEGRF